MARTAELAFIVSVKSELDQLQRDLDRTNRSLGKLGGGFANTKKLAGDLERGLLVVGGAAIAGTAIAGKMAMDFEASMQKIVGLVGISQTQVDAWSKQLLLLGPKLGKGPEELADALYYVTSAGIKASDAIGVLEASAMASVAGLGTTSDIANAVTSAINAYGIENLSAARATDILTAAVKYGKMEAAEMAPVMGQVVPMASALKVSFDQVAGAMAVMSRTGMDASESAVSLNAIFTGMLKPSVEGRKELEAHGLSMAKLRDMIKQPGGVLEVMRLLDTTYGDDAEALAKVIPNVRSMRGLMNILAQDAGTVDEVMQGTTKSVGENGKAFRTAAETDLNKFNRALSQVQSSAIVYGFATLPQVTRAMTAAADVLADLTAGWMKLTPAEQDSRVNGALVAAAFLAVGYGAVKGASGVMVLTKAYGELKAAAIVANAAGGTAATGLVTGLVALSAGVNYLTYQAVMPAQVAFGDWIREMTGT
ncbi:MAG TPA: phage tail tape measure protein, partial [Candidatus Limnocylindrales bacterium]